MANVNFEISFELPDLSTLAAVNNLPVDPIRRTSFALNSQPSISNANALKLEILTIGWIKRYATQVPPNYQSSPINETVAIG